MPICGAALPPLPSLLIRRLGILVRNLTTSQERPLISTRSSHCSASSCGEFVSSGLLWRGDASTTIMLRRVLSGALIVLLLLMLHVGLLCAALTSPFHGGMDGGGIEKCLCELAREKDGAPGAPIYGKRVFSKTMRRRAIRATIVLTRGEKRSDASMSGDHFHNVQGFKGRGKEKIHSQRSFSLPR